MKKQQEKCIGFECKRSSSIDKFCGFCYKKFKKGILKQNGELTFAAESEKRKKQLKEEKKLKQLKIKILAEKKSYLKEIITVAKLKTIQDLPEYKATFSCPILQMQVCQANCINRMFLAEYTKKECKKCSFHNEKYDTWIKDLKATE
jgi:hypothetical protein